MCVVGLSVVSGWGGEGEGRRREAKDLRRRCRARSVSAPSNAAGGSRAVGPRVGERRDLARFGRCTGRGVELLELDPAPREGPRRRRSTSSPRIPRADRQEHLPIFGAPVRLLIPPPETKARADLHDVHVHAHVRSSADCGHGDSHVGSVSPAATRTRTRRTQGGEIPADYTRRPTTQGYNV